MRISLIIFSNETYPLFNILTTLGIYKIYKQLTTFDTFHEKNIICRSDKNTDDYLRKFFEFICLNLTKRIPCQKTHCIIIKHIRQFTSANEEQSILYSPFVYFLFTNDSIAAKNVYHLVRFENTEDIVNLFFMSLC